MTGHRGRRTGRPGATPAGEGRPLGEIGRPGSWSGAAVGRAAAHHLVASSGSDCQYVTHALSATYTAPPGSGTLAEPLTVPDPSRPARPMRSVVARRPWRPLPFA